MIVERNVVQWLLDLYDRAAGVRQQTIRLVGNIGQVEQQVAILGVRLVADHMRQAVDADGAELDGFVRQTLRRLPYFAVLPGAGRYLRACKKIND